jgi:hypothetical protein
MKFEGGKISVTGGSCLIVSHINKQELQDSIKEGGAPCFF